MILLSLVEVSKGDFDRLLASVGGAGRPWGLIFALFLLSTLHEEEVRNTIPLVLSSPQPGYTVVKFTGSWKRALVWSSEGSRLSLPLSSGDYATLQTLQR